METVGPIIKYKHMARSDCENTIFSIGHTYPFDVNCGDSIAASALLGERSFFVIRLSMAMSIVAYKF